MSLSFFSGRIFTTLRAGLALNVVGSPVNGFVPWRSLVAGLCCTTTLQTPWIVNDFGPRLLSAFLIWSARASNTLEMSRLLRPVASAMLENTSVLVGGLGAAFAIVLNPP